MSTPDRDVVPRQKPRRLRLPHGDRWTLWDWITAQRDDPIIIGPFRGELGFEVLYWLPWLTHWRMTHQIASRRLHVITRGGLGACYDASDTKDLYDLASAEDCRIQMRLDAKRTQMLKQTRVTAFDRRLVAQAATAWGFSRYRWVHPSRMFLALRPWWEDRWSVSQVLARLQFDPLVHPEVPTTWQLPAEYVAVRFYARATFPFCADTLHFTEDLINRLAKRVPVVLLNSGVFADDHADFAFNGPNILTLPDLPLNENLRLQAAVLARASGFVGTYGGLAQLALRLGIPSTSFYYQWGGTARAHLWLSQLLSLYSGVSFQVLPVAQVPLMRGLLG